MSVNLTKIEWVKNPDGTQGYTWNPITGCLNGCEYCYARKLANGRLKSRYLANNNLALAWANKPLDSGLRILEVPDRAFTDPFYPRFWEDRLTAGDQFLKRAKRPLGIFPCDMSDWCGIGIPESWSNWIIEIARRYPQHRFYLLTKQPQNLIKFSPFPPNCWVGVTTTDEAMFNEALWQLSKIKASIKYISIEPFLKHIPMYVGGITNCGINQIIIGAQTKPYKPPEIEWVEEIVQAAGKAGAKLFLKNNLDKLMPKYNPSERLRQEIPG